MDVAVACDLRDKAWEKKVIAGAGVALRLAVIADHPDWSEDEIKSAADRIGWSAINRAMAAHAEHPTAGQCNTANNELSSLDTLANLANLGGGVNAGRMAGADAHADAVLPAIREAQAAGAKSLRAIAAALNARGIATARGGKWEATTVRNILRRGA